MKVVHLVHTFSSLSETFIYDYIQAEKELGVDCEILTFNRENEKYRPFSNEKIHKINLPIWDLRRYLNRINASVLNKNKQTANWNLYRKQLSKTLDEIKPDMVHAHFGPMGVLLAPLIDKLKLPLVVSFHGRDAFELPQQKYWKNNYEKLFLKANAVTVVSNYMKSYLVDIGCSNKKIHLIHVGKNLSDYTFQSPQKPIKKWISVGRLSEKKGFLDCLKAFSIYLSKNKDAKLSIIGDGPDRNIIKATIERLELQKAVTLHGAIPHEKVIEFLSKTDAFILCSKAASNGDKEGIPTVLMEAQAMGLPCISTQHSGIPEVIPAHNQQFLAPESDVDAIAQCIEKLYNCTQEELVKIAKLGRDKIINEFNIKLETDKLVAIYQKVSSHGST